MVACDITGWARTRRVTLRLTSCDARNRKAVLAREVALWCAPPAAADQGKLEIVSGKVTRDHVHVLVVHRLDQPTSRTVQWLKGISSWMLP